MRGTAPKPYSAALVGDMLRLFDATSILIVGLAIYFVYLYPDEPHTVSRYLVTLLLATIVAGSNFQWLGVYNGDFLFTRGLRVGRMLSTLAITFALLLSIAFAMKVSNFYSRVWVVTWFLTSAALLSLARFYLGYVIRRLAHGGRFANRTIIVGTGAQADRLAIHLAEHDAVRTRILGFIDDELAPGGQTNRDHGILGGIDDLIHLVRNDRVDQIFISLPWNRAQQFHPRTRRRLRAQSSKRRGSRPATASMSLPAPVSWLSSWRGAASSSSSPWKQTRTRCPQRALA